MMQLKWNAIITGTFIFFLGLSTVLSGCLDSKEVEYIDGNIGQIQVSGDIHHIKVNDYHVVTLLFNHSSSSLDPASGIIFNEDVIAYKITGNVTNIAGVELKNVLITFRFYGGISKGVFVLHTSIQESNYVDPDETWKFDIRFEQNDPKFSKINFFDIKIETEKNK